MSEYKTRHHYSDDELRQHQIEDYKTDIRCAYRDGLIEYAKEQEKQLAAFRAQN